MPEEGAWDADAWRTPHRNLTASNTGDQLSMELSFPSEDVDRESVLGRHNHDHQKAHRGPDIHIHLVNS